MGKVVYLLGAGASFGKRDEQNKILTFDIDQFDEKRGHLQGGGSCANITEGLPIVSELPGRMLYALSKVWKEMGNNNYYLRELETFAANLKWIQEESEKHSTIDTFAKKLWLRGDIELYLRLKTTLALYFTLEQLWNKPDKRYDAFWASILGESVTDFPQNVSIISWNYDCQLELSYNEYKQDGNLDSLCKILNESGKLQSNNGRDSHNGFGILKLNGSALMQKDGHIVLDPFFNNNATQMGIIGQLITNIKTDSTLLSFAWEKMNDDYKAQIMARVNDANTLVIIGYSFPFFNRSVDRFLFAAMPELSTIYVQDDKPDGVEESVQNLLTPQQTLRHEVKIIKQYQTTQFVLPPEL